MKQTQEPRLEQIIIQETELLKLAERIATAFEGTKPKKLEARIINYLQQTNKDLNKKLGNRYQYIITSLIYDFKNVLISKEKENTIKYHQQQFEKITGLKIGEHYEIILIEKEGEEKELAINTREEIYEIGYHQSNKKIKEEIKEKTSKAIEEATIKPNEKNIIKATMMTYFIMPLYQIEEYKKYNYQYREKIKKGIKIIIPEEIKELLHEI